MDFDGFDEYTGYPTFDFGVDRQSSTRKGKIDYSNIGALLTELFPLFGLETASHPDFPVMKARRCQIRPLVGEKTKTITSSSDQLLSTTNQYNFAEATIEYSVNRNNVEEEEEDPNNQDPVSLLRHRWAIGGEFLTVPSRGFEWAIDNKKLEREIDIGIFVPTIEHQITWPRIQSPPFTAIRNSIGKCNSTTMSFQTGTINVETLLFLGADLNREVLSSGELGWEVSYRFSERRVLVAPDDEGVSDNSLYGGWNHFYRSDNKHTSEPVYRTGWYRLQVNSDQEESAAKIYQTQDFAGLFLEE